MSSRVQLQGLDELRLALRSLPADLANEAGDIVIAYASEAKREVEQGYPTGPTGNLRRGVTMTTDKNAFSTTATVKSNAKHVHIYENGTVRRQTAKGANRGVMPKAPAENRMIPKVIRVRARMRQSLIELVKRAGFEVSEG